MKKTSIALAKKHINDEEKDPILYTIIKQQHHHHHQEGSIGTARKKEAKEDTGR